MTDPSPIENRLAALEKNMARINELFKVQRANNKLRDKQFDLLSEAILELKGEK